MIDEMTKLQIADAVATGMKSGVDRIVEALTKTAYVRDAQVHGLAASPSDAVVTAAYDKLKKTYDEMFEKFSVAEEVHVEMLAACKVLVESNTSKQQDGFDLRIGRTAHAASVVEQVDAWKVLRKALGMPT